MTEKPPVTGPIPLHVRHAPSGAVLDLSALSTLVVQDVLELLLSTDDPSWRERLDELAEMTPEQKHEQEEAGVLAYEQLVQDMAEAVSSRVPVYGPAVARLASALLVAARRSVPTQRGAA
ncbi:hypothetical protein ACFVHW_32455 [Streptomyces sp. NPDC127110]|uniref:hypothetical protein n=1 Tax=Streptomyces sp. NPDC127110 TaxID=3345362 RepID=UPI003627BE4B